MEWRERNGSENKCGASQIFSRTQHDSINSKTIQELIIRKQFIYFLFDVYKFLLIIQDILEVFQHDNAQT